MILLFVYIYITINNNMDIPFDLILHTASYLVKPKMKFLDWIPKNIFNFYWISKNPNAIHLLEKYPDKINWMYLSANPNAIHILKANINKIDSILLLNNPNIFEIDTIQMNLELTKKANDIDF